MTPAEIQAEIHAAVTKECPTLKWTMDGSTAMAQVLNSALWVHVEVSAWDDATGRPAEFSVVIHERGVHRHDRPVPLGRTLQGLRAVIIRRMSVLAQGWRERAKVLDEAVRVVRGGDGDDDR